MGLLGYQVWKAEKVESGECRQTIRARRKNRIKVGEKLYHYSGLRTPNANRLRPKILDTCTETFEVSMMVVNGAYCWSVRGEKRAFSDAELLDIARRDGFGSVLAMSEWFHKNHLPRIQNGAFVGDVIRW